MAGEGSKYVRHFDSGPGMNDQRRLCTLILYLNPFWCKDLGGELWLYPDSCLEDDGAADEKVENLPSPTEARIIVEPVHGRLLAFLCNGRNSHEVRPSWRPRMAITWWVCAA